MKPLSERNPLTVCAIGCAITAAAVIGALSYDKLPFINTADHYAAYFADAGGLAPGAEVLVSGMRVGQVKSVALDGPKVLVNFDIDDAIQVGDRTEAAIKTKTVLGAKDLEITPRGDHPLSGTIPLERTTSPYQLADALGDLTATISGLDTDTLSQSLTTLADAFSQTPPELRLAVNGVAQFSETLNRRDQQLRSLLEYANKATTVLAKRSDQVVGLISDSNALLLALKSQSSALDQISRNISAVSQQVKGLISDNKQTLKGALDKLNVVLGIVDNRRDKLQKSINLLSTTTLALGDVVGSGPFYGGYIANLLPGQFLQPFIEAAFSDLGLDPHTLPPSQLSDPQVGQPGTPALPVPYPRTGRGGESDLTLPDAITGNPGDPRYPYREPLPAPPPGGPPPGPPALGPHPIDEPGPVPTTPAQVGQP